MTPDTFRRELQAALGLLDAGRGAEARARLTPLIEARPAQPDAHALMGLALEQLGDLEGGAAELRQAISLNPRQPQYRLQLGHLLLAKDPKDAEDAFRSAAELAPRALEPLQGLARAQKAQGRQAEAVATHRRIAAAAPANTAVRHNLAAALNDAGESEDAEATARTVLSSGADGPETWLVLGRALEAQGRYDEAEAAYGQALRRRPDFLDAHADLSELTWMRTGDVVLALGLLERQAQRGRPLLDIQRARILDHAGQRPAALAMLRESLARNGETPVLLTAAANAAGPLDPALAMDLARRAAALAPQDRGVMTSLCLAQLAAGEAAGAAATAERLADRDLDDQFALALLATAWRLLDDSRHGELNDYALVRTYELAAPPGWSSLSAYLADLAQDVEALHDLAAHPIGQSLRHGSQTRRDLKRAQAPAIRAFFEALNPALEEHSAWLGQGVDPVRRRNTGRFRLAGAWSVRLRPQGFHASHVHPRGWLSSAFYVDLPASVTDGEGREGWIQFGEPGCPTQPPLPPQHDVRPRPGLLVLFPSYIWHGTVPFSGDRHRLTIAFDVVPEP